MKKFTIVPLVAIAALSLAACSKPAEPTNVTDIETNTVVEDTDTNFSAVDGVDTENATDLSNAAESNTIGNAN